MDDSKRRFRIVFIGSGNLATNLTVALQKSGQIISQIYSRTEWSAKTLAKKLNTSYTVHIEDIEKEADIYFITVKDAVIEEVISNADFKNKLIVHCAGSLSLSVLENHSSNFGVFYPLQTFSKSRSVSFSEIPIFIESNSIDNEKILFEIASHISEKVSRLDSDKRKFLHIAAVFACNFVNHFYTIAGSIIEEKDISFDVLKPLILETALKVQELNPYMAQTGPAVRYDRKIIDAHLNELESLNNYKELYQSISESIFSHYKK